MYATYYVHICMCMCVLLMYAYACVCVREIKSFIHAWVISRECRSNLCASHKRDFFASFKFLTVHITTKHLILVPKWYSDGVTPLIFGAIFCKDFV